MQADQSKATPGDPFILVNLGYKTRVIFQPTACEHSLTSISDDATINESKV